MKGFLKKIALASTLAMGFATNASAAVDVSNVTLDVASVETIAGVMLGALALIWVARKVVSFLR